MARSPRASTSTPERRFRRLSVAKMQIVEIAKALSLRSRVLLLDEPPASLTPQQAKENLSRLLRRQRGGRLVEQQDPRAQRKRFGDLHELHLGDVELRHRRSGVEIELEDLEPSARLGMHGVIVDRAKKAAAEPFEKDVLADRKARNEIAFLMDDADPRRDRVTRPLEANSNAVQTAVRRRPGDGRR